MVHKPMTTSFFNCRVEHRPLLEEVAIQSGARITNVFAPAREQYTNLWWMRIEFEAKDRAQCLRVDDAVRGAKVVLGLLKYTGDSAQEQE